VGLFGLGEQGATVTVGTFDGVHLAHLAVLQQVVDRASRARRAGVVVTFDPHPLEVVRPERAPRLLTTEVERRALLAASGVEHALVLRFDAALAALSPAEFVDTVLLGRCGLRELVIGYDHGFGRGRSGDVDTLRQIGAARGFEVTVVQPVEVGGERVSSSAIREALEQGALTRASGLLGRPYDLIGQVVPGARRGRSLGVPTINLEGGNARKLLPPDGVYAVQVEWHGGRAGGMMNQGPRPTFGDPARSLEVHLFGVDADLYGEWVRVEWVARLRDVRRFETPDALKQQIERDRAAALAALNQRG
jgi:riboflavin kinase/FMN adenylyltransferase